MEPDGNSSVALTPAWHSIGARAFPAPAWHYGKTSTPQGIPNTDGIDYSQRGAVVVVEGATLATFVTGAITMLIIGVLLNIVGLGIFCWALFALATHALPFFVLCGRPHKNKLCGVPRYVAHAQKAFLWSTEATFLRHISLCG
jgi:hypothetical protein